jgi:hypothetical protein
MLSTDPKILPINQALRALTVIFFAVWVFTTHAHAQTAPLPYGTVEYIGHQGPQYAKPCNPRLGWVNGTTCVQATMHCDPSLNVDDITFTYGYEAPTGANMGTVVALNGQNGTTPDAPEGWEIQALESYVATFEIVQVKWDSAWEASKKFFSRNTYGNIQYAACRPAGLLHFVYNSTAANGANPVLFQSGGGMCAHGSSAGSAAIVYALAWYGAGYGSTGYLDNVELLSGPVLSEVDTGCEIPQQVQTVDVCKGSPGCKSAVPFWSVTPEYIDGYEMYPRAWSNIAACANTKGNNTTLWNPVWNNMSILSSSITPQQLSYPKTSMNAWLCASVFNGGAPMNNSSSQGWLFYQKASWDTSLPGVVNAVTSCDGSEGVMGPHAIGPDGKGGLYDVTQDMLTQCKPRH